MDKQAQALNKKLAKWWYPEGHLLGSMPSTGDILWGTKERQEWVNFPDSLDDCFKWLVPKLQDFTMGRHFLLNEFYFQAVDKATYTESRCETPALALCLAIEKLIDSEDKK